LFLELAESSSASELKIATKCYITMPDEKDGKILHQKAINDPVPMAINYGDNVLTEGCFPIGYWKDYLKIPSVAVRIYLEYEKDTITTSSIANLASSSVKENALKSSWSSGFGTLFTNQSGSDICFIIEGQEVKAHKTILSARSPVFAAMFHSDMMENLLNRVDIPTSLRMTSTIFFVLFTRAE